MGALQHALKDALQEDRRERYDHQLLVEDAYSRKNIRRLVRAEVDPTQSMFQACKEYIKEYILGNYYESKNARILELISTEMPLEDIVTELYIAILPIQEISPIQAVAAQLGNRLGFTHVLDAVKTAAEIIAVCEHAGLYTLYHSKDVENDTGTLGVRPNYQLEPETLRMIQQTMYLPPMLCKPRRWHTNTDGGYLEGSGSVILGAINHHEFQQDLESLNILQSIPWELNHHILAIDETPNKHLDTEEKVEQFETFKNESRDVYNALLGAGNEFYFVWKNDKRGRAYCQGYHVNLQGTEYKKAVINFKNKELLT